MLDLAMREASGDRTSLRDLFRWMNEHYAKQGKFFNESASVRAAAENVSHADLWEFFQKYVSGTDEIPWDKFFARVGLRVVRNEVTLSDPGFDAVQKFDKPPIVVVVQPGSDAARAGLKAGDAIVVENSKPVAREFGNEIAQVAPGAMLHLSIRRDGVEQNLEWRMGGRKQTIFQLRDVPEITAQQRERRAAWLFDKSENNPQ